LLRGGQNLCLFTEGLLENEADICNATKLRFFAVHAHDIKSLFEVESVEISFNLVYKLLISSQPKNIVGVFGFRDFNYI